MDFFDASSILLSMKVSRTWLLALLSAHLLVTTGCMTAYKKSVGAETQSSFRRVYATDFNTAWQAVLDALKSSRLDVSNRESGVIITRWSNNTAEKNFTDGDGTTTPYMKAQYRFKINVSQGYYKNRKSIQISVQKEQVAQRDALDELRPLESDTIEENTLLYRVGRLINVRTRLAKLEESRVNEEIKNSGFNPVDASSPANSPEMTPDSSFEPDTAPAEI
jgi:hypothetical protein